MTWIEAELQEVFKKKDTIRETITSSLKKLIPEEKKLHWEVTTKPKIIFLLYWVLL